MTDELPPELVLTGEGPIRVLTLHRPDQRNAANEQMHRGLAEVWGRLEREPDLRVVIVTGAGQAFSAGGDLEFLSRVATDSAFRYETLGHARRIVTEMLRFPLPVIAAVNGPAVGLGCSLAVLCDIVLMSETAYLADPHVSLGLVAADGGVLCWPLLTSLLRAKELLFTGDRISAPLACELGLANRAVAPDDLLAAAHALAERLAAQPAQALRDTKRAINLHLTHAVNRVLDFAFSAESETFGLADFARTLDSYRTSRHTQ